MGITDVKILPEGENFKISVAWESRKLDSSDAGNDVLQRPVFPQDIKKLKTGGTGVKAIGDGVRHLFFSDEDEERGVYKIGMVGRMGDKKCFEAKVFSSFILFEPSLVDILLDRIDSLPRFGFSFFEQRRSGQGLGLFRGWKAGGFEIAFSNEDWIFRDMKRELAGDEDFSQLIRSEVPGGPSLAKRAPR